MSSRRSAVGTCSGCRRRSGRASPGRSPWRGWCADQSRPATPGRSACHFGVDTARPRKRKVHRGFGCPRASPETMADSSRVAPCRTSAVAGRTKLPWRRRERQSDGSATGGPSAFFRGTPSFPERPATGHPASPDARSRRPCPRTTAAGTRQPSRAPRLCEIAHQVFVEAGPGALPARIVAPADDRDAHEESPEKTRMAPHCVRTIRPTPRSTLDVQPETGKCSAGFGNTAGRRPKRVGASSRGLACN